MALKINYSFDENTYRQYINGINFVMHCHHYMALTTKLALQFSDIGGPEILANTCEDSVRPVLDQYHDENGIDSFADRLQVGAEFFAFMGLGKLEITGDEGGGKVAVLRSHVDEGWKIKFGKSGEPLNHFTCGYVAAIFASAAGSGPRSYAVEETSSIAAGADSGEMEVSKSA